ncbi:MAG: polyprenyl synthetase family protein [Planctomycetia bacterium]|nr:polyprenyl synthetase family protein [Planctomycetia bacterium]
MPSPLSATESTLSSTSAAATSASVSPFVEFATEWRPKIDAALAEAVGDDGSLGGGLLGIGCPTNLAESIRYSLLAPGKRLRPLLVLAAARACGGDVEAALPAACAVEMIHSYSLVHDDLPAMDDDDLRRGRPTNHKVFGEGIAILAGDALLTLAFEILANKIQPPRAAAQCCGELARAAGACELVGGQADDLAQEGKVPGAAPIQKQTTDDSLAALEAIHRRKTGAMLRVSLRLGAIVAGADAAQLAALAEYGARLGLTFQIMDDLLDVLGSEAAVGKRVGKDAARGKLTYPGLLGVEESRRRAERLTTEAIACLAPFGADVEVLEDLARYVVERNH